jgi:hypothetical protein
LGELLSETERKEINGSQNDSISQWYHVRMNNETIRVITHSVSRWTPYRSNQTGTNISNPQYRLFLRNFVGTQSILKKRTMTLSYFHRILILNFSYFNHYCHKDQYLMSIILLTSHINKVIYKSYQQKNHINDDCEGETSILVLR